MMTTDLRMCVACQFYAPLREANTGKCRRNPPTVYTYEYYEQMQHDGVWPTVEADMWCGEFRRRHDPAAEFPDPSPGVRP